MKEIIKMPHLGETMEEGRIVTFYVKEGDYIEKGDIIFDTETDKTTLSVESYKKGYVRKIFFKPGDVVKVGEPVLLLTSEKDEPIEEPFSYEEESKDKKEPEIVHKEEDIAEIKINQREKKILATPLAKKIAKEYEIELSKVKEIVGNKIIKKDDIERYLDLEKKKTVKKEKFSLTGARKVIGDRMVFSKSHIPHFYLTISVNMSSVKTDKEILNQEITGVSISYTDFILKALSLSLLEYRFLNAHYDRELTIFESVNIGIAVDKGDTLIVPVLKNIEDKDILEISRERRVLIEKALSDKLKPQDLEGATFTISNLGPYNIDEFAAIINPPQVGILAVGKIKDTPIVEDGKVRITPIMKLTLSGDHRAIDGAYGAKFLDRVKALLEHPVLMWK